VRNVGPPERLYPRHEKRSGLVVEMGRMTKRDGMRSAEKPEERSIVMTT
jgi:hypothetical protein